MASLKSKPETLEGERKDLEQSEARLKSEIDSEEAQVLSAPEQIRTRPFSGS